MGIGDWLLLAAAVLTAVPFVDTSGGGGIASFLHDLRNRTAR